MNDEDDGFLSRWSRRKALVRQGVKPPPVPEPAAAVPAITAAVRPAAAATDPVPATDERPAAEPAAAHAAPATAPAAAAPPKPTLDDVAALTPESDFSRFVARDVDPQVRNSALKKLFADPHYNVMDGLDIYIDDYHTPDPLPKAMLRQLVQARMLGLLDDEMPEQPASGATPPALPPRAGAPVEVEVEVEPGPGPEAANDAPAEAAPDDTPAAALPPPDDGPVFDTLAPAAESEKADKVPAGRGPQAEPAGPSPSSSGS